MPLTKLLRVFEDSESACTQVAAEIAQLIRARAAIGRSAVLGLASGKSTLPLYQELAYLHREEGLSFHNVITFNLDEYYGLDASHPASFRTVMQRKFFDLVDIPPANVHFLSGKTATEEIPDHCADYESQIRAAGGIDHQILSLGRNGHIGFNEPFAPADSRTRWVELNPMTRTDAARSFGGIENVPTHALTMGCGTILNARKITVLVWGSRKARIVHKTLAGPISAKICASYLKVHPATRFYLNPSAAKYLTAVRL